MEDNKIRCPYCREWILEGAIKCRFCGSMLTDASPTGPTSISNPETLIRQALGDRYELHEVVGRGGMATVYRAVQKNLNRVVALKVIHQNLVHETEFVSRFIREAQLSASLSYPNIVTVYDVGSVGSVHYMAMEFLEGNDLHQMVKQKGALDHEHVTGWMAPVAQALHYIHQKGLVHRDIKSSNIIITKEGRPVLMDFGIAHAADGTRLTQTGTVIGTPEYMSPEQAQGKPVDHRSDLYSLGVVMYECLTGKVPFKGDNPLTTIHQVIYDVPQNPTFLNYRLPGWLESVVLKLLEKEPVNRLQSGSALAGALANRQRATVTTPHDGAQTQKMGATASGSQKQSGSGFSQQIPPSGKVITPRKKLIYIVSLAIIVLIGMQLYLSGTSGPVKISWDDFEKMAVNRDVEQYWVTGKNQVEILLKKDKLSKYYSLIENSRSRPAEKGPHFLMNIESQEIFENKLNEILDKKPIPKY